MNYLVDVFFLSVLASGVRVYTSMYEQCVCVCFYCVSVECGRWLQGLSGCVDTIDDTYECTQLHSGDARYQLSDQQCIYFILDGAECLKSSLLGTNQQRFDLSSDRIHSNRSAKEG